MKTRHVVIVGGGFAGLAVALKLRKHPVNITLIDRTNHHLFQPLLYQVAMGALAPGDIATPFRNLIQDQANVDKILEEVTAVHRLEKCVELRDGTRLYYDTLIVATGNQPAYFGHPEWAQYAPGLKTLTDALSIREQLFRNFEAASRINLPKDRQGLLTAVAIGAGPTGVEVAGSIAEVMRQTIRKDFRNIAREELRVVLIEGGDRVLPGYLPELSAKAKSDLEKLGVEVWLNTFVEHIDAHSIRAGGRELLTEIKIWAAGNQSSPLIASLNTPVDKLGRAIITPQLHLPDDPDVFVLGDAAHAAGPDGQALPGVAQVAMQQGQYVAKMIKSGELLKDYKPFKYFDKGTMATIGRAKAVVQMPNGWKLTGLVAWLIWAAIHVIYLVAGRNRYRVFAEWVLYYITFRPGSRLIYGTSSKPSPFATAKPEPSAPQVAEPLHQVAPV